MSITLALLAASALTRATPTGSPGMWISDADYPAGALSGGEEGSVGFSLLVSPEGRVKRCSVTQSSGFTDLDRQTCVALVVRATFRPARDENHVPSYDLYDGVAVWRNPEKAWNGPVRKNGEPEADLIVDVLKLPDGGNKRNIIISARVDEDGKIAYCEAGKAAKKDQKLADVACDQMRMRYQSQATDDTGKPLQLIRGFRISFRVSPE